MYANGAETCCLVEQAVFDFLEGEKGLVNVKVVPVGMAPLDRHSPASLHSLGLRGALLNVDEEPVSQVLLYLGHSSFVCGVCELGIKVQRPKLLSYFVANYHFCLHV